MPVSAEASSCPERWIKQRTRNGLSHWHCPVILGNEDNELLASLIIPTPAFDDSGAAHALEHWVLRGSVKYPDPDEFFSLRQSLNYSEFNASTQRDRTCFHLSTTEVNAGLTMLDYLLHAAIAPLLREEEFNSEIFNPDTQPADEDGTACDDGVLYREMCSYMAKADFALQQQILAGSYYAYGGIPECISQLTPARLRQCFRHWYRPELMTLVTSGPWPAEEIAAMLEQMHHLYEVNGPGDSQGNHSELIEAFPLPGINRAVSEHLGSDGQACLLFSVSSLSRWQQKAFISALKHADATACLNSKGWRALADDSVSVIPLVSLRQDALPGPDLKLWLAEMLEAQQQNFSVNQYWYRQAELESHAEQARKWGRGLAALYQHVDNLAPACLAGKAADKGNSDSESCKDDDNKRIGTESYPAILTTREVALLIRYRGKDQGKEQGKEQGKGEPGSAELIARWLKAARQQFMIWSRESLTPARCELMDVEPITGLIIQCEDRDAVRVQSYLASLCKQALPIPEPDVVSELSGGWDLAAAVSHIRHYLSPASGHSPDTHSYPGGIALQSLNTHGCWLGTELALVKLLPGAGTSTQSKERFSGPDASQTTTGKRLQGTLVSHSGPGFAVLGVKVPELAGAADPLALYMLAHHLQHSLLPLRVQGQVYGYGCRVLPEMGIALVYTSLDLHPDQSVQLMKNQLSALPTAEILSGLLARAKGDWQRQSSGIKADCYRLAGVEINHCDHMPIATLKQMLDSEITWFDETDKIQ
nr:insulinase family protein [Shewanella submarina]